MKRGSAKKEQLVDSTVMPSVQSSNQTSSQTMSKELRKKFEDCCKAHSFKKGSPEVRFLKLLAKFKSTLKKESSSDDPKSIARYLELKENLRKVVSECSPYFKIVDVESEDDVDVESEDELDANSQKSVSSDKINSQAIPSGMLPIQTSLSCQKFCSRYTVRRSCPSVYRKNFGIHDLRP
jgi:hypothetical protein